MKNLLLALGIAAFSSAALAAAQKDDVPVTIIGCLYEGTDDNTFVFTDVVDLSESKDAPASAVYWLSTTKGLKEHIGHKVEITGTYSPSRDAGKTATISIDRDDDDGAVLAVESGMKKAETSEPGAVGTSGVIGETSVEKPYRRLKVKNIRMIAESCR